MKDKTRAALLSLGSAFSFAAMTATIRGLKHLSLVQTLFFRCAVALLIALSLLIATNRLRQLRTTHLFLHFLRGMFGFGSMFFYFIAYRSIPLADAHSFGYTKPLFISIFGVFLLKEKYSFHRITSILFGFLGVLIMFWGAGWKAEWGALSAVAGALLAAFAMVLVRVLNRSEDVLTIVVYFMLLGSIISGVLLPFYWQTPTPLEALLLCATGSLGVLGQILMVGAYRIGEIGYVGGFDYSQLLWAALLGALFWGEAPTLSILCGCLVIIFSQITLHRMER